MGVTSNACEGTELNIKLKKYNILRQVVFSMTAAPTDSLRALRIVLELCKKDYPAFAFATIIVNNERLLGLCQNGVALRLDYVR